MMLSLNNDVNADLILTLSGSAGSNVVHYQVSGSVTITNVTADSKSGFALAPIGGSWNQSFDNNLGDILRNGMSANQNDGLALTNGGVSYRLNGIEFGVLDSIDLDGANGAGLDDIELNPSSKINFPTLAIGDVISWTGSGTFTLEDGETFDSLFIAVGSWSNAIDGGNFTVNVAAVSETRSLFFLLGAASVCVFVWRRPTVTNRDGPCL